MTSAVLLGFVAACILLAVTPGPNMAYLAVLSASQGRRAGYAAVLGIGVGLLTIGLAAALGLAVLISSSRLFFEMLRWSGVAYLLWLAWDGWRDAAVISAARTQSDDRDVTFFMRGLITNLLNPKAMVFYVTVLPTFTDAATAVLVQTVILSVVYVLIATTIYIAIVSLAGSARPFLEDRDRRQLVRRILSVTLVIIAIWFAFITARKVN